MERIKRLILELPHKGQEVALQPRAPLLMEAAPLMLTSLVADLDASLSLVKTKPMVEGLWVNLLLHLMLNNPFSQAPFSQKAGYYSCKIDENAQIFIKRLR